MGATVFAQSYYTPGQTYTFRNKINETQCIKVDVVFDANGNATVSKSLVAAETTDKANSFVFCEDTRVTFDESANTFKFNGPLTDFFVINLDNVNQESAPIATGSLCIICDCKGNLEGATVDGNIENTDPETENNKNISKETFFSRKNNNNYVACSWVRYVGCRIQCFDRKNPGFTCSGIHLYLE